MIKLITAPTSEPVTLDEVKAQSVIDIDADDTLLGVLISAAREDGENRTRRSWTPKTLEVVLDEFPSGKIELPLGPVTEITSVKYIDTDGVEQTLDTAEYDSDMDALVAYVQPVDGGTWPDTKVVPAAVRVRYEAGWEQADVPVSIKQWLMVRVASLYAQRENHIVGFAVGMKVGEMGRGFADVLLDAHTVLEGL